MISLLLILTSLLLSQAAIAGEEAGILPSRPARLPNSFVYVPGSTQKVCQLTGEMDRQFHKPTVNRTASRFGMGAADLGYSFEHHGKLFFLFGDSVPTPKFHGRPNGPTDPPRIREANDAIAFTSDTSPGDCPRLEFIRNETGAYKNPVVLNSQGQRAITLATNETPVSGISHNGKMYVIFITDNPTHFAKPPEPLGYSTRSVVAVSEDDGKTWRYLYDFSRGPGAKFINIAIGRGGDGYLYFWGTQGGAFYRKSAPYMARMRADNIGRPDGARSLEYLAGLGTDSQPRFSHSESDAAPLFQDCAGDGSPNNCMGELGVDWNRFVKRWVMLYNCLNDTPEHPRGIYMRLAEHPWGPWSEPQTIFNPIRDHGYCYFMHRAVNEHNPRKCDDLTVPAREGVWGGEYAPYFISRFTTGDEARGTSTFYYTMATWNPYTQVIMKSTIRRAP
jgi:hypothetical protein